MKFFMELLMSEVLMGYESVLALQPTIGYIYVGTEDLGIGSRQVIAEFTRMDDASQEEYID